MDVIETVSGDILSKLFEIASFADLRLHMNAERSAPEEKSGKLLPFRQQVGINADFGLLVFGFF